MVESDTSDLLSHAMPDINYADIGYFTAYKFYGFGMVEDNMYLEHTRSVYTV